MGLFDRLRPTIASAPLVRTLVNLFGHRRRRIWSEGDRSHVELRALTPEHFGRFSEAIEASIGAFEGVRWLRINGALGRLIVSFDPELCALETIVSALEVIERGLGIADAPFAEVIPDYPADVEPIARKTVDLAADGLGVLLGTGLKLAGYRPSRAGFDAAALLTVVDNTPRVRQVLTDYLGFPATEISLGVTNAFVQAIGAGPIGPLVDMLVQGIKLRAELARRRAWRAREPELCGSPGADGHWAPLRKRPRPTELPEGAVERYANEALFASLGGFVVGLADTHDLEAATAPLFGGLPKAALYGRTVFGAELMRTLASRGVVVLRTHALRLLDRMDAVVIHERVLIREGAALGRVTLADDAPPEATLAAIHRLFDGERADPWDVREDAEGWRLAPLAATLAALPEAVTAPLALAARERDAPVLLLARDQSLVALVELQPALRPGAEALLASARRAGLRLVLAVDDPALERFAEERVPTARVVEAIRDVQCDGDGVLLIADGPPEALAAADVGVGITLDVERPPWSADLLLRDDLTDAIFVLEACAAARDVAQESVVLAGVGAALGAAIALGGLRQTKPEQVMLATNAASAIALGNGLRKARILAQRPPPPRRDPTPWHRLEVDAVLDRLGSSAAGLDPAIAAERRRVPPPPPSPALSLARAVVSELANPLTPVLAAGAALSAVTGSLADAALITGVFGLNGVIGGLERFGAEREIAALERSERPAVAVCRAGAWTDVDPDELVVGDLIELRAGEVVPADARLIGAADLEADESSLTGESLPITKDTAPSYAPAIAERTSMIYEGTAIAAGVARAIVVATGDATEARRGEQGAREGKESGVEARLRSLTEMTLPVAGLSGALLMGAGLFRHQDINQLVDLGVSMTVAAVPEGLPLLATVAQLAAARRLSARGAIVRNPRTVEALGRVDVLCADKTGTLTEGRIALHSIADAERIARCVDGGLPEWAAALLAAALRASPAAEDALPHPTDRAVVVGAGELGVTPQIGLEGWQRMHELPFEPGRGYHGALGRRPSGLLISVKGAPEVLVPRCDHREENGRNVRLDAAARATILARAEALAADGLRVLAVAERAATEERDLDDGRVDQLCFRGFIALSDPPRATAAAALERLRAAGIDALMITGDHPRTAARIAEQIGLLRGRGVLTGPALEAMSDEELDAALTDAAVIARATPADKVRIVKALQRRGRVVAMTGDGANDASAIRLADVGVALGEQSTTAAREAADLVVVDERIDTIVDAIAEGRAMWSSVRDAVAILIGGNLGEIGFTLLTGLLGGGSPLNARQLLLINLLTDVAPAMAIALRPPSEAALHEALAEGPEAALGDSLDREIALRAVTTAVGAGAAHVLANITPGGRRAAPTVSLLALVGAQLGQTLTSGRPTTAVVGSSLASLALLLAIVETPGVSHIFGCRPVGPLGLVTAFGTSAAATIASNLLPTIYAGTRERLRKRHGDAARRAGDTPSDDTGAACPDDAANHDEANAAAHHDPDAPSPAKRETPVRDAGAVDRTESSDLPQGSPAPEA